jgi:hypothetical protein
MGLVIPLSFLTPDKKFAIHKAAEMKAIEMAIRHNINGCHVLKPLWDAGEFKKAKEEALDKLVVLRHVYVAKASEEIDDLSIITAVRSNDEGWGIDTTALTADAFSSIFAANEALNQDQAIVFYGFVENSTTSPADLQAIKFKNGTATIDIWQVEHATVNEEGKLAGLSENLVVYAPKDKIDIQVNYKTAVDKSLVLFNILVEPQTNFIQPKA